MSGVPVFVDDRSRPVHDPAIPDPPVTWIGANRVTFKLMVCLEAIRDLTAILAHATTSDGSNRVIKSLAVPLHSLMQAVESVFNELESNAHAYPLDAEARKEVSHWKEQFTRSISFDEIKLVRDKIAAHIDLDVVNDPAPVWQKVNLEHFLGAIAECATQVMNLLSLDTFAWWLEDGDALARKIMSVDGTLVHLSPDAERIMAITFAPSPKFAVRDELVKLTQLVMKARLVAG